MNKISNDLRMRCIQVNLRHGKRATSNLSQLMLELDIDCALIQEPYVIYVNKNTFDFYDIPKNYEIFHSLTSDHAYGAIVAVKSKYNPKKLGYLLSASNNCVGIKVNAGSKCITIISLYCRPSVTLAEYEETLNKVFSFTAADLKNVVIGADLNAKNRLWGSKTTNQRGFKTEESIAGLPVRVANKQSKGGEIAPTNYGLVDVTFAGDNINIKHWKYLEEPSLSDHPLIYFEISAVNLESQRRQNRVPGIKQIDETHFKELLKTKFTDRKFALPLRTNKNVDDAVTILQDAIKECAFNSKKKDATGKQNKLGWWNAELWSLRSELKKAQKMYFLNKTTENNNVRKLCKAEYQRKIRQAKARAFKDMCSDPMNRDLFGTLKTQARQRKESQFPTTLKIDNNIITKNEDICVSLLKGFFPGKRC